MSRHALVMAIVALVAGCASPPIRYYRLAGPDQLASTPDTGGVQIVLDTVTVPQFADRMQLVVEESDTQVRVLEHERWAAPLRDQIASVLIADLRVALKTQNVIDASQFDGHAPALHLKIEIEHFDARRKGLVLIAARWQLTDVKGSPPAIGFATVSQPLGDDSPDAMVLAWSENLRNLSTGIAGLIRAHE